MDFEKNLKRLEDIVGKMEKGDISLEDSLKFFEEGVKLSRECNSKLTDAELKVKKLMSFDKDGQPVTEPFASEDN